MGRAGPVSPGRGGHRWHAPRNGHNRSLQSVRPNTPRDRNAGDGVPYGSTFIRRADTSDRSGGFCSPCGSHNPSGSNWLRALPGGFTKNLVYFLCKVCYTVISVHRGWADPGKIKRNTRAFTRAEGPSTRRFRVKGDGAGRLELVRFFAHTPDFLLIERTQYRTLASLTEGGGPRSGGGSVLKQSIHRLLYSTPPVSYR